MGKLFRPTVSSSERGKLWEAGRTPEPEGIVEDYPIEEGG
jgi:hypothetical protein